MLITQNIPMPINGVSQQPADVRLPTQGDEQINGLSHPVRGLGKRPPTQHIARLQTWSGERPKVHYYDRDGTERYVMIVDGASDRVRVYDLNGRQYPVLTPAAIDKALGGDGTDPEGGVYLYSYLDTGDVEHSDGLEMVTISDTTLILNKTRFVETTTDSIYTVPQPPNRAYVWVRGFNYATTADVFIDDVKVGTYTSDVDLTTDEDTIRTSKVAQTLANGIQGAGFTVVYRNGDSTFAVSKPDGTPFRIEVKDSAGNQYLRTTTHEVKTFTDLPPIAHKDHVVTVLGNIESQADNYYVRFRTIDNVAYGPGVWEESAKPGIATTFNPVSMPIKLTREFDQQDILKYHGIRSTYATDTDRIYFRIAKVDWAPRTAGDDDSNPMPSFVNKRINDIFLYRNRLGFVSEGSVILSASGDLFNFFRESVISVADDDPIDVTSTNPKAVEINYAVPWNEELLLVGLNSQMILRANGALTTRTVEIETVSEFDTEPLCRPARVESNIFIPYRSNEYAGMRMYFANPNTSTRDSFNLTANIPTYITSQLTHLAVSTSENTVVCLPRNNRNILYIYKWLNAGQERLMSSWSKWEFLTCDYADILFTFFIDSRLYLLVRRFDGQHLEYIDLNKENDEYTNFVTLLDRRISSTQARGFFYDTEADETHIVLPYRICETELAKMWAVRRAVDGGNASLVGQGYRPIREYTVSRSDPLINPVEPPAFNDPPIGYDPPILPPPDPVPSCTSCTTGLGGNAREQSLFINLNGNSPFGESRSIRMWASASSLIGSTAGCESYTRYSGNDGGSPNIQVGLRYHCVDTTYLETGSYVWPAGSWRLAINRAGTGDSEYYRRDSIDPVGTWTPVTQLWPDQAGPTTSLTNTYTPILDVINGVTEGIDDERENTEADIDSQYYSVVVFKGQLTASAFALLPLWLGTEYTFTYTFSPFHLRTEQSSVTHGDIRVRTFSLLYHNTGAFDLETFGPFRSVSTYRYARTLHVEPVGGVNLSKGEFRCLPSGKHTEVQVRITSPYYLPCWTSGAHWEGLYVPRARGV